MKRVNASELTFEQTAHMLAFLANQVVRQSEETNKIAVTVRTADKEEISLTFTSSAENTEFSSIEAAQTRNESGITDFLAYLDDGDIIEVHSAIGIQKGQDGIVNFLETHRRDPEILRHPVGIGDQTRAPEAITKTLQFWPVKDDYSKKLELIAKSALLDAVRDTFNIVDNLDGLLSEEDTKTFNEIAEKAESFSTTGLEEPTPDPEKAELRRTFQATLIQIHKKVVPFFGDKPARNFIESKTGYTVPAQQLKAA